MRASQYQPVQIDIDNLTPSDSEEDESVASGHFGEQNKSRFPIDDKQFSIEVTPPHKNGDTSRHPQTINEADREDSQPQLFFSKQKQKLKERKPLFESTKRALEMNGSILSSIEHRGEQTERSRRMRQLRQLKEEGKMGRALQERKKEKKKQKIIWLIRSTYD